MRPIYNAFSIALLSTSILEAMYPDIISLGPLTLHTYGLCMGLGFLGALLLWRWLLKGSSWDTNTQSSLLFRIIVSGLLGARLAYVVEHINEYSSPLEWFRIDQGGLMFYGGFLGAGIGIVLFCRAYKKPLLRTLDIVVTALPLGHAFGRLGCFLNGCCHGILSEGPLGVRFPFGSEACTAHIDAKLIPLWSERSLPVYPVQLFESFGNLLLLLLLIILFRKKLRDGTLIGIYLMAYPILRFATERFRADPRLQLGAFSIAQAISICLFLIGAALLALIYCRPGSPTSSESPE